MPRRYGEEDVRSIIGDPGAFGLHLWLVDRFGGSGVIAIVIGRLRDNADLEIDAWLMSCRALGRQVEPTTLNLIAERAKEIGARRILSKICPDQKEWLGQGPLCAAWF